MTDKELILSLLNFESFYRGELPDLSKTGKDEELCLCPFHEDKNPSLSVNLTNGLFHCFACPASGDIFKFVKLKYGLKNYSDALEHMAAVVGVTLGNGNNGNGHRAGGGLTLEEFAAGKKFDIDFLKKHGVKQVTGKESPYLVFAYKDPTGKPINEATRMRFAIDEKPKGRKKGKLMMYGLHALPMLRKQSKEILLFEGESDLLTAWLYKIPALSIPGKTNLKTIKKEYFTGFETVYVWQEPGAADFPAGIAAKLRGVPGLTVKALIPTNGTKDISDAHVKGLDVLSLVAEMKAQAQEVEPAAAADPKQTQEGGGEKAKLSDLMAVMRDMNQKHAVVKIGGKCRILEEITNHKNLPDITLSSVNDMRNFYAPQEVRYEDGDKIKTQPLFNYWFYHTMRRQYKGIEFSPGGDVPGYFNLWNGFAVEPRQGDWVLLYQHIFEIICGGNQEYFDYFMNWLADLFQNPGRLPGVAVVFRGGQGIGKGVVAQAIGKILGPHFRPITNHEHLLGRFTFHLKDCLLCYLDECTWGGDKKTAGILKGLITEETLTTEQKGVDAITVNNYKRVLIASNSNWVVPVDVDDRRFFFLEVSSQMKGDHEYFKALWKSLDQGAPEAMLYDLLHRDLTGFNIRDFPKTEGHLDQKKCSMRPFESFWQEVLQNDSDTWKDHILKTDLHDAYKDFCNNVLNERYKLPLDRFSEKLRKMCKNLKTSRPRTTTGPRPSYFEFPSLEESRQLFEEYLGVSFINWHDDEDEE